MVRSIRTSRLGSRLPMWLVLALTGASSFAQEPLHVRIDNLVASSSFGLLAPPAADAEFVRRIYLDVTGRIPAPAEVRAFLDDPSPQKRIALIDRLFASPQYTRHLATGLNVMINERRPDNGVPAAEWEKFLFDSVAANKPFDQLAREILGADGADPNLRPAVKFYLDRQAETNLLTRDVGRIFFGVDLQCAQCHDHPLIDDYSQSEYYGLYAFLNRTSVFTDKKDKNKLYLAENADGDVAFSSVFTKKASQTGPRLIGGDVIAEPTFNKGEEYSVAPAAEVRSVPKFSRRGQLAALATNGTNRVFNRNIANRLWAHMTGRGLVEPLDLHHSDNPPAHPQLLELLTDEIVAHKFDIKAFLREIALSQTYQRAIEMPSNPQEPAQAATQQIAALEAETQRLAAVVEATRKHVEQLSAALDAADKVAAPIYDELKKSNDAVTAAQKPATDAATALANAQKLLADKQDVANVVAVAAAKTQEAAKKLPDDKELAAAAEKFVARSTQFAAEVVVLTQGVTDKSVPAKATAEALAATQKATADVQARLAVSKQQVDAARQQFLPRLAQARSENGATKYTQQRTADAKSLAGLGTLLASATAARAAAEVVRADLAAGQQTMQRLTAETPKRQADLAEAQKGRDEAVTLFTQAQQQFATKQDAAKSVAEAAAQAEAAKQKLPNDAELAQATQNIKTRSDQLAAEVNEMQKVVTAREQAAKTAADRFAAAQQVMTTAMNELAALQQKLPALEAQLKQAADKTAADAVALAPVYQDVTERWTKRFFVASFKPLTPEQIAWSMMQATGVVEPQRAAVEAELNKTAPLDAAAQADPVKVAARAQQMEAGVFEKLKGNEAQFVNLFSTGAGQPQDVFFATADQALFFANGPTVRSWLSPGGGNLTERMLKLDDPKALADELYVSVFSRRPTDAEVADVTQYLAARPNEKPIAVQELAWALLTSAEFRFNH